ncbi:MAG TPA: hypothetical protein VF543_03020 [Pyrinomonadaceae bacterium]|jgi:hypothetical protein
MMHKDAIVNEIDRIVQASLVEFVEDVFRSFWNGREREAVSLYVLGYLQKQCGEDKLLREPTQIGIEAAVPSSPKLNSKGRVCKDLVLWREPKMTCWNERWEAVNPPLSIMEWKVFRLPSSKAQVYPQDVAWLKSYATLFPSMFVGHPFVGYAVALDLLQRNFRLSVTRVESGEAWDKWLEL